MAVTTSERQALYSRLTEVLGPDHAGTLMQYLSPVPVPQLASKDDIGSVGAEVGQVRVEVQSLRAEVGQLRVDVDTLRAEVGQVRVEVQSLRAEVGQLRAELAEVRIDTNRRMDRFEDHLQGFHSELREQARGFVLAMVGSVATVGALAFGAAALI